MLRLLGKFRRNREIINTRTECDPAMNDNEEARGDGRESSLDKGTDSPS